MKIAAQRVSSSRVTVNGAVVGEIGEGLCILVGVAPEDTKRDAERIAEKIANLRIFGDDAGKMNRSLLDVGGAVLAVSQFTLYADCRKGRRPSFVRAAPPDLGNERYRDFVDCLRAMNIEVATGVFGAEMKVEIVNEGPVTIVMDSAELFA
jgi:D-tyrosyl-tRNA(Tyr) deacylase